MSLPDVPPAALWRRADFAVLTGTVAAGLAFLAAGWWGVTGTRVFDDQVAAARLAAAGVLLALAGFVWLTIRGRRALGLRLRRVGDPDGGIVDLDAVNAVAGPRSGFVAAADMTRYHRPDCPFAAGKAFTAASVADHEAAGRRPCGVCRP
jgi:hypothetical protein